MKSFFLLVVLLWGAASAALAQTWARDLTYSATSSRETLLKVTGAAGMTVSVELDGETITQPMPYIFTMPDRTGIAKVTARAGTRLPNGTVPSATESIEFRKGQMTSIVVRYTPPAGAAPAQGAAPAGSASRNFVGGRLANECPRLNGASRLRFDFIKGDKVYRLPVSAVSPSTGLTMPGGVYSVRMYFISPPNDVWLRTREGVHIDRDGWSLSYTC